MTKLTSLVLVSLLVMASTPASRAQQPGQSGSGKDDPISGDWNAVAYYDTPVSFTLTLKLEGDKVTGATSTAEGSAEVRSGTWQDGVLAFETSYRQAPVAMRASLKDGALDGTWSYNGGEASGRWEATRKAQ